jgi:Domain of unknown function (DUF1942)
LNTRTFATALVAATVGVAPAVVTVDSAPIASADSSAAIQDLGNQLDLTDGSVVQRWTVSNLNKSTDEIPYPVQGTLWEATATDEALQGTVVPIVSNLNARGRNGQAYRVLFQVATPQGVNPATLAQGQMTSGKVYFDVTGDIPDSVVYNAGGDDLLVWMQPQTTATPAVTKEAPKRGGTEMTPASPPGNQGTPLQPGWQGTPLPASAETPPTATPPTPPGNQGTPLQPGWQGTALPASAEGSQVTTTAPVPGR